MLRSRSPPGPKTSCMAGPGPEAFSPEAEPVSFTV
jgi:hypothetical protein